MSQKDQKKRGNLQLNITKHTRKQGTVNKRQQKQLGGRSQRDF